MFAAVWASASSSAPLPPGLPVIASSGDQVGTRPASAAAPACGPRPRLVRADGLGQAVGWLYSCGDSSGAIAGRSNSKNSTRTRGRYLGEPRDHDCPAAPNSDDRRLGHRPRQVADAAAGSQHPAERACALGVRSRCMRPCGAPRSRGRAPPESPDPRSIGIWPIPVRTVPSLVLPHRGLRQCPESVGGATRDPSRHGVPVAVVIADEEQRDLKRKQLEGGHLQAGTGRTRAGVEAIITAR